MPATCQAKWDGHAINPVSNLEMIKRLPINTMLTLEFKQRRSAKHHRRLFGLIRAAYDLWPEQHEFQPENESHLRAWLTIKAKHGQFVAFDLPANPTAGDVAKVAALAVAEMARHEHAWAKPHGNRIVVWHAKTIAWSDVDQREFSPIAQAMEEIMCTEIGTTADKLLAHASELSKGDEALRIALAAFPDAEVTERAAP